MNDLLNYFKLICFMSLNLNLQSLCNACGIRFKKEEKRANTAAVSPVAVVGGGGDATEKHRYQTSTVNGNPWAYQRKRAHKLPSCYSPAAAMVNEFRFIDDVDDKDSPFMTWRLNVTDRAGLVNGFTR